MNKIICFIKSFFYKVKYLFIYKFYKAKSAYKAVRFGIYKREKRKKNYFRKVLKLDNIDDVISSIGKTGFIKDIENVTNDIDAEKLLENSVHTYLENKPYSKRLPISIELYSQIEGFENLEICILSKMSKFEIHNKWGSNCSVWIAVSSEWFINYNNEVKKAKIKQNVSYTKPLLAFKN